MSVPHKNDFVINPQTKRPVKVGTQTWTKLVKQGILDGNYADDNILDECKEDCSQDEIDEQIQEINSHLPAGLTAARGRGKYANKIVKRHKQLNIQEITKKTSKLASKIVNRDEDIDEDELEQMIFNELMIGKPKKLKQTQKKSANYQTKEITDCSQSESEEDEQNI